MTTKTGDQTKAQILADSKIDDIQWNRNLNFHAKKAIKTACEFTPSVSGDWATSPTTSDAALNELGADKTDLITLSGVARASVNLGSFSGSTIADNQTIKAALQALETAVELKAADNAVVHLTGAEVLESKSLESSCALVDATDNTKTLKWNLSAQSAGVDLTITSGAETADRTISIPVLGGNKTLSFVDLNETISGAKDFTAANIHFSTMSIVDQLTTPKRLAFSMSGATASKTLTLACAHSDDRTVTLPNANGTIALTTDIGADVRATASVQLVTSAVKDLHNSAVELIAAPAAGQYIQLEAVELLTTGTTGYDGVDAGEDLTIQYSGTSVTLATVETTGWLDQNSTARRFVVSAPSAAFVPSVATAVTIKNSGAVFAAAGDHGLKIKCYYRVLTALT